MKVSVISRKLIKPSTPTPPNLKTYKLSFIDEIENDPRMNVVVILFYPPNPIPNQTILLQLEESLSRILPQFYPLAGRYIKNGNSVDCSDQGVEFAVARVDDDGVDFVDLASTKEMEALNGLLPCKSYQVDELLTDPLLSIQVTEFLCGGQLVISVRVSHGIFDASSVATFIAAWSNANNNNSPIRNICPSFEAVSLFASMNPGGQGHFSSSSVTDPNPPILTVKKFSFSSDAIKGLKSNTISRNSTNISRVRVVCAIIAKAMTGVDKARHGGKKSRPCVIMQSVNLRGRTIPPLPEHSCGNLLMVSLARCMSGNTDDETANGILIGNNNSNNIQGLVDVIGNGLEKTLTDCAKIFSPAGGHSLIMEPLANMFQAAASGEVNVVVFSDWSKFGFYEAHFGWGQKPLGVGIGALPVENMTILVGSRDGDGIEAWVHLYPKDMAYFEQDEDIKLYTMS